MQPSKGAIKREPVEAQAAPALRLYEVKHPACPLRLVQAYNAEEAQARYREWYGLHASRALTVSEAPHAYAS